jgi:hypothetical protein
MIHAIARVLESMGVDVTTQHCDRAPSLHEAVDVQVGAQSARLLKAIAESLYQQSSLSNRSPGSGRADRLPMDDLPIE